MLNHKGSIKLKTKRLELRQFFAEDFKPMFYNWANDEKVSKYVFWKKHKNIEKTKALVLGWTREYNSNCCYNWAVTLKGEPIGNISVSSINEEAKSCFIGYCLAQKHWGLGYGKEMVLKACEFLLNEVGFKVIYAQVDSDNLFSSSLLLSCGFKEEKGLEEFYFRNDKTVGKIKKYKRIGDN